MLFNKLKQMERRPGMFPCENVGEILTYIEGYAGALGENSIQDTDFEQFGQFTDFVKEHYNDASSHANWAMIIRYHTASGRESFDTFFKLLNEFIDGHKS